MGPVSTGPDNLYQLATALLVACQGIYLEQQVDPPSAAYVYAPGEPTAVCDQLVVSFGSIYHGRPAQPIQPMQAGLTMPRTADLFVWVFRCLTDTLQGQGLELTDPAPVPARANYDAQVIMTDAYILHRGIIAAHFAGTFKSFADGLAVNEAAPIQAAGGIGGMRIAVSAELS